MAIINREIIAKKCSEMQAAQAARCAEMSAQNGVSWQVGKYYEGGPFVLVVLKDGKQIGSCLWREMRSSPYRRLAG